jgi:hypothetical protein
MSDAEFNLDSLLDGTLDDLADMPEFRPYPVGTHRVNATLVNKTEKKNWVNGHPGYELKMKAIETIELANTEDTPLQQGAETGVLYLLDNEMGQGSFKKILASVAEKLGPASNRELAAQVVNLECLVVTKQRQNKDKTATYTDIVELQVV